MPTRLARLFTLTALLVLPLGLLGCDSGGDESDPTVTGSWTGNANFEGSQVTLSLQLTERDQLINGSGSIQLVNTVAVSASGTHNFPNVSLTLTSTGLEDLNFQGTLSGDGNSLSGSLSGSGFENFGITLRK